MSQRFVGCDREQEMLLPPSLRDWLAADHLAWFVIQTVEQDLDLSGFYGAYRADGHGRPAHDPAMMVALVLYAYAVGIRSSRAIERACQELVPFRVIAANQAPDHTTINRFRGRHQDALADLFTDVLGLCAQAGMVRVGEVAIDGSKLAANASLRESRSYRAIRAEVDRIFEQAAAIDAAEDEKYGSARGDEVPAELFDPRTRRAHLQAARRQLEAEHAEREQDHQDALKARAEHEKRTGKRIAGRKPQPPDPTLLLRSKRNVTDPDSRIMHHRGQLMQAYNPQILVTAGQIIVAANATNHQRDPHQLLPMLQAARQELTQIGVHEPITTVLADGGYFNQTAIQQTQHDGVEVLIAPPKQATGPTAQAMRRTLTSSPAKARYRRRAQIVEPVFAHIKHHRAITRFMRRGLPAVNAEWRLIAATHNLLKLYTATTAATA